MTLTTTTSIRTDAGAPAQFAVAARKTRLQARGGWRAIDLSELWRYRELIWFLALRDIKVRYKQTVLGAAWVVIQPLFMMIVFSLFFGKLGGLQQGTPIPYPLLTFCALLPWQLFSNALNNAGNSLIVNQNLITKVYFPRLAIPLSAVLVGLLDFGISFLVLVALILWYRIRGLAPLPGWPLLTLPLFISLALAAALAVGLWLSALSVEYRDVRYTLGFLTQFWMFITPVAYSSNIVPKHWRLLYGLNPMVGVVDGFRWCLLGQADPPGWSLLMSTMMTFALLVGGLFYFRRMERTFADVV